jgi:glycine/D-amino acid oxidase-like deaminating enzyme
MSSLPASQAHRVIVLGAGVVGLTTAVCLLHDARTRGISLSLEVWADAFSPSVTSDGAGASFIPTDKVAASEPIARWVATTGPILFAIAAQCPDSGVDVYRGTETLPASDPSPWYLPLMAGARRIESHLPGIDRALYTTYEYSTPIVDMAVYLPWLQRLVSSLGGAFTKRRVTSIERDVAPHCDAIVNCTGLGARWLVPDSLVQPVVGVIVNVQRPLAASASESRGSFSLPAAMVPAARLPPGSHFHRISLLDGEVAYIYPRRDKIVLGGTYLPLPKDVSMDGPDAWRKAFDEDAKVRHRDAILRRCELLEPGIEQLCPVIDVWSGARPVRPTVRCELVTMAAPTGGRAVPLVHHYGHGGQGVLLSWGSALDAARLLLQHFGAEYQQTSACQSFSVFQLLTSSKL